MVLLNNTFPVAAEMPGCKFSLPVNNLQV